MRYRRLFALGLATVLLLSGCHREDKPEETRPLDTEFTASYDWMAGESPVPNRRIGLERIGFSLTYQAVGPNGVYFISNVDKEGSHICYVDNGSDHIIPLCGRSDCTHNNTDCNAYIYHPEGITFYRGFLYVTSGNSSAEDCKLIRMEPDGSSHVTVLDATKFAKEHGGDYAQFDIMTDGYLLLSVKKMVQAENENGGVTLSAVTVDTYYYALDGSMEEPRIRKTTGILYNCGDTILVYSPEAENGGEFGSDWAWDPTTDTTTFLTDDPGVFGYFDDSSVYYFDEGKFYRLDNATGNTEILFETELKGRYSAYLFPDCILLAARDEDMNDNTFYIYNWAYELVDEVELTFSHSGLSPEWTLLSETAERFILTDDFNGEPLYYIEKSELGTGNAVVHEFQRN